MSRTKRHNAALLAAVSEGVEKANKRSVGEFDGLHGSLPEGTAIVLNDVVAYLREYLLDEKGLPESDVRSLFADSVPIHKRRQGFRSVSKKMKDEGIRVAVGILSSIASVLSVKDGQINPRDSRGMAKWGGPLGKDEAMRWLLSGEHSLYRHRYLRRQRETSRSCARARSADREDREHHWRTIGMTLRRKASRVE